MDSIKDVVRSSVKVPEFDKHLKKAGGHIGQNVVEIKVMIIIDNEDEDNSPKTLNETMENSKSLIRSDKGSKKNEI